MGKFEVTILSRKCMEVVMELNFDQVIESKKLGVGNLKSNKDLR